ncbi:MAG: MotA/TolQ/ExbB proton channel family protein [Ferrovibrio sp.]|uniref:MotA/TolQ/ExbB proton channel family protein n=1 Tax=Ferrovibrio sp. TaxID=1917215 RepID=UPI00391C0217
MNHDFSFMAMILNADPVVQLVMALLVLTSIACWAIMIEKTAKFGRARRAAAAFEAAVKADALLASGGKTALDPLQGAILAAAAREKRDGQDIGESRHDFRARMEGAMRQAMAQQLRQIEPGLPFLATVGSAAPFIGLFGTVWGIMNSFTAIAGSNDTSLAVVAPGIAEALFATALGLVAAIPAVIAYNKLSTDLGRLAQRFNAAISEAARQFVRGNAHAARSHAEAGQ